jgi:uncharacterized protein (TIGR02145 family)
MNRTLLALMLVLCSVATAQVPTHVPLDGLVSWYPFNGDANDQSENDNHGIINGAVLVSDRYNIEEAALDFNDDSHIEIPVFGVIQGNVPVTLSAWVQIDEPSNGVAYVVGYGGGPTGGLGEFFAMGEYGVSGFHATMSGGGFDVISGLAIPVSEWVMLTAIHDGNGAVRMYMDTTEVFSDIVSVPNIQVHSGYIGASPWWADSHWDGRIDDVGIWSRALSPDEIGTLNTGSPIQYGCNDPDACNYDSEANVDDGSCVSCETLASACGQGTVWDPVNHQCIVAIPTDTDFDGCVAAGDLLNLLATFGSCPPVPFSGPCQGQDHVTYQGYDYDIVAIGEQCWFAENLRVESYANGDLIASQLDSGEWGSTNLGAMDSGPIGKSYNWFAVIDDRGLCPELWHVAYDHEWIDLELFLGMDEAAVYEMGWRGSDQGSQLKSINGWDNEGTNSVGFSAIPESHRQTGGGYVNDLALWWCVGNEASGLAISRNLNDDYQGVFRYSSQLLNDGLSVRCIKDQ